MPEKLFPGAFSPKRLRLASSGAAAASASLHDCSQDPYWEYEIRRSPRFAYNVERGQPMIVALVVIALLALSIVFTYNGLVRLRVQCDNAWADIDVQLKRRYDLIPNLVETVKGYAGHEKGTLEAVINARNRAMSATGPADKAQAENMLSGALKSLFALSEAYPQLRAIESFTSLQNSLSQIEDTVQNARRYYNAVVRDLNTKIQQFPTNIFAGMLGFKPREFFEVSAPAEREAPKVSFTPQSPSA